jgi:FlaA1/EpsC-like NDP-sugar epimerase
MVLIPGWRLVFRLVRKTSAYGRGTLFGKRTLIVGTDMDAVGLQNKLRARIGEGYEIVGFVGTTHERIGEMLNGIPVVGSIDNVGKIIKEQKISDVIFSPKALSYSQILSVISRSHEQVVNYHLVPTTMEVIVGKASVDSLDDVPLVQIAYNIDKPSHLITKRMFDIILSGLLLITVYPIFLLWSAMMKKKTEWIFCRTATSVQRKLEFCRYACRRLARTNTDWKLALSWQAGSLRVSSTSA